jgi:hypothetical protein
LLYGISELRQTLAKLTARLNASSPVLMPILTRWQPLRISRLIEQSLLLESLQPAVRVPARSALFASAAAARVPLAVSAPDSAPSLAYELLAKRITEVTVR